MPLTSIGDLAQSLMLKRQNAGLKMQLDTLTATMASGKVTDAGQHLRGDLGPLTALDASLARLSAYAQVTAETAQRAAALQTVLARIDTTAATLGPNLLRAAHLGGETQLNAVGQTARQALDATVAAMNTRLGDRSLLSGIATDAPALVDAETLMTLARTATASAISVTDTETALDAWLSDPAGFSAQAYSGGAPLADLPISADDSARLDITATDPALRATLKGLILSAMLDDARFVSDPQARTALSRRAGESLAETAPDRAHLSARLGIVEGQIEAATTRNTAEATSLGIGRAALLAADPYDTATRLQEIQSRIETLYALTARLTRLSLADYLR